MKKWIKEPLVHFALLGVLIFGLFSLVGEQDSENEILIDDSDIDHLVELWQLQWQRPPTEEELQGLITKYVDQEILYREALKMNLDHNDEIVKRRLAQKMEFLGNDLSSLVNPPTDENLKTYFDEHQEEYKTDYQYTLYQVVFTTDKHQDPIAKANQVLEESATTDISSIKSKGDSFALNFSYSNASATSLKRSFGDAFVDQLPELTTGQWTGPIRSGFGAHLVYLKEKTEPQIPEFTKVRNEVLRDFEYAMEQQSKDAIKNELKKSYTIVIEADIDQALRQKLANNLEQ